jgi:hypothetical protein
MVGWQFTQGLPNLGQHLGRAPILALHAGDNDWHVKKFRQLAQRQDRRRKPRQRIGLGELHNAGLKVGEENNSVVRIDP